MRSVTLALLVLAAVPAVAAAQEELVELSLGESRAGFPTVRPICDAPSVAVLSAGTLKAVGVGETLCSAASVQSQGVRRVYRVVVKPAEPKGREGGRKTPR